MFTTILIFLIVLSLLVFVHELGHFWVAKKCGLKPEEFGFGFPPRAIGFYKDTAGKWKKVHGGEKPADAADTIYSLNWFPLGGFVKLGEDEDPEDKNANHFNNKPIWQRALILVAGVTMNFLLAVILFSGGFMFGLPMAVENAGGSADISDRKLQITQVLPGTPAEKAELEAGDLIVGLKGENLEMKEFSSIESFQELTNKNEGKELNYQISRGGEILEKKITPQRLEGLEKAGIGIGISEIGIVKYPPHIAIWQGFKITSALTISMFVAFFDLLRGIFVGDGVGDNVGGPVRIAEITGQAARMGFVYLVNLTALLSVNLAIINILPFPALDGGRLLFLIMEKIKGRPVRKELEGVIHYIGFTLLMLLIIVVTYKDIARVWVRVMG